MNLALNLSQTFDEVNRFSKYYGENEIDALHKLGTLCHHFPRLFEGICRNVPGGRATLLNIVRLLNERTFYMHKPFEAATIRSLLFGQASMGQCSCGAGARATVTRHLANLVKSGVLVKVECHGCPTLYSLNIPRLIENIREQLALIPDGEGKANTRVQAIRSQWAEVSALLPIIMSAYTRTLALVNSSIDSLSDLKARASAVLTQAVAVVEQKAEAVVEAVKEVAETVKEAVTQKIEQAKEVVMNLADALKQVPKGSQVQRDKQRKRAALPLFDEKGRALSRNGIALWDSLAVDFEHVGYEPKHTGKIFGQMKCWLNELAKRGMSEDEIREKMSDIVRRWHHIVGNARITAISKNDKLYGVDADRYPNFASFYPYRDQYSALLVAANVPLSAYSKKEMEEVDFERHNIF